MYIKHKILGWLRIPNVTQMDYVLCVSNIRDSLLTNSRFQGGKFTGLAILTFLPQNPENNKRGEQLSILEHPKTKYETNPPTFFYQNRTFQNETTSPD